MKNIYNKSTLWATVALSFGLLAHTQGLKAQSYCTPSYIEGCSDGSTIHDFKLIGENGTSIEDMATGCSSGAYDNKTSLAAPDLYQGETYTLEMSTQNPPDQDPIAGSGMVAAVWIDFNDNGEFEATEKVAATANGVYLGTSLTSLTLTIPSGAQTGTHRMRAVIGLGVSLMGQPILGVNDLTPCPEGLGGALGGGGIDLSGEAHDYSVNILEPGSTGVNCDDFVVGLAGTAEICSGGDVTLDATTTDGTSYEWNNGETTPTITVSSAGTYTVEVSGGGCTATASVIVSESTGDDPIVDDITVTNIGGTSFLFGAAGVQNGDTYSWDFGDGNTGSGESTSHTYATEGDYTVTLTVSNACGSTTITMDMNTSTASLEVNEGIENLVSIYPNPASSILHVELGKVKIDQVVLTDVLGKQVAQKSAASKSMTSIDTSSVPRGAYFITINSEKGAITKRIIITN